MPKSEPRSELSSTAVARPRLSVGVRPPTPGTSFAARTVGAQLHALGLVLVLWGGWALVPAAAARGPEHFWAVLVFLVSGGLVFLTSATYHFLHDGFTISTKLENLLENLDHYCIYLFIAGTYTPVLLNAVAPPWRERMLVAVWAVAVLGIGYTSLKPFLPALLRRRGVSTFLFVCMGWLAVFRVVEIYRVLSSAQWGFLLGGVASYSVGALVYATQRPRLFEGRFGYHELWHCTVLLGAVAHYWVVRLFYLP